MRRNQRNKLCVEQSSTSLEFRPWPSRRGHADGKALRTGSAAWASAEHAPVTVNPNQSIMRQLARRGLLGQLELGELGVES